MAPEVERGRLLLLRVAPRLRELAPQVAGGGGRLQRVEPAEARHVLLRRDRVRGRTDVLPRLRSAHLKRPILPTRPRQAPVEQVSGRLLQRARPLGMRLGVQFGPFCNGMSDCDPKRTSLGADGTPEVIRLT